MTAQPSPAAPHAPVETLDSPPTLGVLYGRALLTARSGGSALPDRRLELVNVRIDGSLVADYDHVCGFSVGGDVPPTYPHMLAFPLQMRLMTDREFPLPAPGMVHLRNIIAQVRPPVVGEPLRVTVHADRLAAHPKGAQVDLVTTVADEDGTTIWDSRSTYFVRGAPAPAGADDAPAAPPEPDPHVGRLPHAIWTVPGDIGRRYAAVSGDVNPIHVNGLAAKAFGMPGTIAHGMWTKARALAALAGRYGPAFTVDVVFKAPVRAPSKAYFHTAAVDGGWDAKLVSPKGRDHLLLTLREG
ncbi:MaoC family dehydratase [Actinomycetospora straminea]|uniref:MaoC/PaaZ C-terminal domain-containing protein n=1 Tax=Actinomycetospora straminea TaxID=663607 RepID=A0ABP9EAN5_9PSEU|nr:MaoC/PaaZ C-terminal domain-containing protein [Actinomycetospora straminea]MDD7935316.1 MaoC/PaaZ C-terminal domain-containing protein [Actinomycetospora straminea]